MRVALNKMHFPVTTLGPGRRIGIWLQGCSLHCPGCVSRDTWDAAPEHATTVASLLEALTPWLTQADGVTLSGGEPFEQPEALAALAQALREAPRPGLPPLDLLAYSGFPWAHLQKRHGAILALLDGVISEPYQATAGASLRWRGSDNQRLHALTDLGRERYGTDRTPASGPRLDVVVDSEEGTVWMAGIPAPGDLERLRTALAQRGYACQTSNGLPSAIRP